MSDVRRRPSTRSSSARTTERLADYQAFLRIPSICTLSRARRRRPRAADWLGRPAARHGLRARRGLADRRPPGRLRGLAPRRGRADGARLRPLRRPAGRPARPVGYAAVRAARRGRPHLRPRRGRRQGPGPPAPVGRAGLARDRAAGCRSTSSIVFEGEEESGSDNFDAVARAPTATGWRPTSRSSATPASTRATCRRSRSACAA